jgi:hypothetical protein
MIRYIVLKVHFRGQMQRKGIQPKDHMKENVRQLRQAQLKNREDKEEAERPERELYKLAQFRDAQPRVYEGIDSAEPTETEFLTRGASEKRQMEKVRAGRAAREEVEQKIKEAAYLATKPPSPRKASVPRADEVQDLAPRSNADFIHRNKVKALSMQPKRRDEEEDEDSRKHREFGRVPEYLEERKAQWAEAAAERRRSAPDPSCPPGMTAMPEHERLSTLETLQQSRRECLKQLEKMPFVIETPSMIKKQQGLELKLREIENAIGIFSRPKVYIAK